MIQPVHLLEQAPPFRLGFPGACKLHDREWRIPAAAIEAFDAQERQRERPAGGRGRAKRSLSDWRHAS